MLDKMRGTVARGVAVAGLATLLVAVPAWMLRIDRFVASWCVRTSPL